MERSNPSRSLANCIERLLKSRRCEPSSRNGQSRTSQFSTFNGLNSQLRNVCQTLEHAHLLRMLEVGWPRSRTNYVANVSPCELICLQKWAISAVVAQQLYTLWVGGSNPSSPTIPNSWICSSRFKF